MHNPCCNVQQEHFYWSVAPTHCKICCGLCTVKARKKKFVKLIQNLHTPYFNINNLCARFQSCNWIRARADHMIAQ